MPCRPPVAFAQPQAPDITSPEFSLSRPDRTRQTLLYQREELQSRLPGGVWYHGRAIVHQVARTVVARYEDLPLCKEILILSPGVGIIAPYDVGALKATRRHL